MEYQSNKKIISYYIFPVISIVKGKYMLLLGSMSIILKQFIHAIVLRNLAIFSVNKNALFFHYLASAGDSIYGESSKGEYIGLSTCSPAIATQRYQT